MPSTFKILTYRSFEPTEISGLKGWYDASTLTGADGSAVSQWLDSSGNEANMFQSTTAAQPSLQTAELNGKNVVRFDGIDDFMNMTQPFSQRMNATAYHNAVRYSPDGNYLAAIGHNVSPFFFIYKRDNNGIYNKLANPADLPVANCQGVGWSRSGDYLVICSNQHPFIFIYKRTGDTFTKLSDPAILPTGLAYSASWSTNDEYLAISHGISPFITIYQRSGDTFTKISNPAILPSGTSLTSQFSPDSNFLAVGSNVSPFILIYSRSGSTFTKTTDPTTLPLSQPDAIDWLSDSTQFITIDNTQTFLRVYQNNSGTFQQATTISVGFQSRDISLSSDSNYLAVGHANSPFFSVFSRSGNTYTKLANPSTLPTATGRGVSWHPLGNRLAVASDSTTSPNLDEYTFQDNTLTSRGRLNMFRNISGASVFVVRKKTTSAVTSINFFASTPTLNSSRILQLDLSGKVRTSGRRLDGDTIASIDSISAYSITNFEIVSSYYDYQNTTARIYLNGKLENTNSSFQTTGNSSDTNSNSILIGALNSTSNLLVGDIAEIIIYNRALTAAEITNVHEYLSRKWGITLA